MDSSHRVRPVELQCFLRTGWRDYLGEPCQPRLDVPSRIELRARPAEASVAFGQWPRANRAHLAGQDVDELRISSRPVARSILPTLVGDPSRIVRILRIENGRR